MHAADLRRLLDAAHRGGESRAFLDSAAADLHALLLEVHELRECQDRRRRATRETGRRIQRLRSKGLRRAAIVERMGISVGTYHRALASVENPDTRSR